MQRLYATKLMLVSTVAVVSGLTMMVVAVSFSRSIEASYLRLVPIKDIGSALMSAGLIAFAFEYLDREDSEVRAEERLRRLFPSLSRAVVYELFDQIGRGGSGVLSTLSDDVVDRVAIESLSIRLRDEILAREIYADLRNQVIGAGDYWQDFHVSIILSRYDGPSTGKGSMMRAYVKCEYKTLFRPGGLRFACVSDIAEYRQLVRDPRSTFEWYFEPIGKYTAASRDVFRLHEFHIDGRPQAVRRTTGKSSQTYVVELSGPPVRVDAMLQVSYMYSVLIQRNSHIINIDISKPSRGFRVELVYGNCGIRFVNLVDFIASSSEPHTVRTPNPVPSVSLAFDSWVFPKSGVAFVWVLEEEL